MVQSVHIVYTVKSWKGNHLAYKSLGASSPTFTLFLNEESLYHPSNTTHPSALYEYTSLVGVQSAVIFHPATAITAFVHPSAWISTLSGFVVFLAQRTGIPSARLLVPATST